MRQEVTRIEIGAVRLRIGMTESNDGDLKAASFEK